MKQYIILGVAIATIFIFNFWQSSYLRETSEYLLADINDLKNSVARNDLDSSNESVGEIKDTWEDMKKGWDIFASHNDVEEISSYISSLEVYVANKDKVETINAYTLLRQRVEHILRSESFNYSNIF